MLFARPRGLPEWVTAVAGAAAVLIFGLVGASDAWHAVQRGTDVYCFLIGMMLLAELARVYGLFDWLAAKALAIAGDSSKLLFVMVYAVGTIVTALLSNDATAVVLTPAVFAVVARTKARPGAFLYACAFIANAASFVLPISNPANLVVYAGRLPALLPWLQAYALPALVAIVVTIAAHFFVARKRLRATLEVHDLAIAAVPLRALAAVFVGGSALGVVAATTYGFSAGASALVAGVAATLLLSLIDRRASASVLRGVSWSVVPLVAGLFVMVQALETTGVLDLARGAFRGAQAHLAPEAANLAIGGAITAASNLFNNLPIALVVSRTLVPASAHALHAALVAVDLGPNLSVTGSLATLLWMVVLRREGVRVSALRFLPVGAVVMVPALVCSLLVVR
jgi:arsenical pump membrane protein